MTTRIGEWASRVDCRDAVKYRRALDGGCRGAGGGGGAGGGPGIERGIRNRRRRPSRGRPCWRAMVRFGRRASTIRRRPAR